MNNNTYQQITINFDEYTTSYYNHRVKYQNEILKNLNSNNLSDISISFGKGDVYMKEFYSFIIKTFSLKQQNNNHTFMQALLEERKETHKRINYSNLKSIKYRKKIPYSTHLSPQEILSNKMVSNDVETGLDTNILETIFLEFVRKYSAPITGENILLQQLQKFFAMQISRRENFLYCCTMPQIDWIKRNFKENNLDILDYLYIKFFYNKAIVQNYHNWLFTIERFQNKIIQVPYFYKTEHENEPFLLALNENHTFVFIDFFNSFSNDIVNISLIKAGLDRFTPEELNLSNYIYVTLALKNNLLFLMPLNIDNKTLEKINFIVYRFWDEYMAHGTFITLLLPEKHNLTYDFFLKIEDNKKISIKNKKLQDLYDLSNKFENQIKNNL